MMSIVNKMTCRRCSPCFALVRFASFGARTPRCQLSTSSSYLALKFWGRDKQKEPEAEFDLESALQPAKSAEAPMESSKNRSNMSPYHRCLALGINPVAEGVDLPKTKTKESIRRRRLFGHYGVESGVDPSELFPGVDQMKEMKRMDRIMYPDSLQEMIAQMKQKKEERRRRIQEREDEIDRKLAKATTVKLQIQERIAKKEAELKEQQEKRTRMLEEIREHFGYSVDPKHEKFQTMLTEKEAAEKKIERERKKKDKQAKALARLMAQSQGLTASHRETENKEETQHSQQAKEVKASS